MEAVTTEVRSAIDFMDGFVSTPERGRLREIASSAHHGSNGRRSPNAVGFYEKMGGRHVREDVSGAFGHRLAVMMLDLPGADGRSGASG